MNIAITGANSSVGKNLLSHISRKEGMKAIAGVRSESAFATLPVSDQIEPRVIRYDDAADLAKAFSGCDAVVHLAGILIESKHSKYESANVDATAAVIDAARQAQVKHLVFISVVGADRHSANRYFRSKGEAEALIAESGLAGTVIRTPLLLGPGTAGADSILWAASKPKTRLLGGGQYTMHPLDVDDLSQAILNRIHSHESGTATYEMVGPEAVLYRDLIARVARQQGREIAISAAPIWTAKLGAAVASRLKGGGITPEVIDVITMDETVANNQAQELGVTLTPLDKTIDKIIEGK